MKNKLLFLFALLLMSCETPQAPQPVKVTKLTKVYSINTQPNGSTFNPKYLPNIGK